MKLSSWIVVAVGASIAGFLITRSTEKDLETTVSDTVDAPIDQAFDYIVPVDLTHVFRGTALIPAIVAMSVKEGWRTTGLVRTITFADGSTSQESLLTVLAPTSFSYKNEHFSSLPLRLLLQRLEGEWHFTDLRNGQTKIDWTYRAIPSNRLTRSIVQVLLMPQVRTMLANALAILKDDLAGAQTPATEANAERVVA